MRDAWVSLGARLRSAALARAVLIYLAAYIAVGAWLPWVRAGSVAPAWAASFGLAAPFRSPAFLGGMALLWINAFACTLGKRRRALALWRGELPPSALALAPRPPLSPEAFLRARGFVGRAPLLYRARLGVWSAYLLHVGVLVLMAGVVAQQALSDSGTFALSEGESARLDAPAVAFGQARGLFAATTAPALEVTLVSFDPYVRQAGYKADRRSVLAWRAEGLPAQQATLDRAAGVSVGDVEIFQAIPTGLSVNFAQREVRHTVHLREAGPRLATAEITDPTGVALTWQVETEHDLDAASGTGAMRVSLWHGPTRQDLALGATFTFGGDEARLLGVTRWAGFTYDRSHGMALVLAGFLLVLLGSALLVLPSGVARLARPGESADTYVYVRQGGEALRAAWVGQATSAPVRKEPT